MTPRAPAGSVSSKEAPDASSKTAASDDAKGGAKGERRDPKEEAKASERKKKKRWASEAVSLVEICQNKLSLLGFHFIQKKNL